ncbi:MAG: hypothetical protein ACOVNY_05550 [Chitinophagaceae bacterium]
MGEEIVLQVVIRKINQSVQLLLNKWKLVISTALVFFIIGVLFAWLQKPKYTAQLSFVADKGGDALSAYAGIASQFGIDLGGSSNSVFDGDNLIELMKSKSLITKTLLTKNNKGELLIHEYLKNSQLIKDKQKLRFSPFKETQGWKEDSIMSVIIEQIRKKHLSIDKVDKKLDFVSVQYTDNNQFFAKTFIENLVNLTIEYYTDYKTKKNLSNVQVIQHQVDSVRNLLFGGITEIASVNDLNVNPLKQTGKVTSQKKSVDLQVNSSVYVELQKNLQLAKLVALKESPLIKIIDKPTLPLKNEKKGRLFMGIVFGFLGGVLVSAFLVIKSIYFSFPKDSETT